MFAPPFDKMLKKRKLQFGDWKQKKPKMGVVL